MEGDGRRRRRSEEVQCARRRPVTRLVALVCETVYGHGVSPWPVHCFWITVAAVAVLLGVILGREGEEYRAYPTPLA